MIFVHSLLDRPTTQRANVDSLVLLRQLLVLLFADPVTFWNQNGINTITKRVIIMEGGGLLCIVGGSMELLNGPVKIFCPLLAPKMYSGASE